MRNKILFTLMFIFMIISNVVPVQANSAAPLYAIIVEIEGCHYYNNEDYHSIDVLINETSYNSSNISDTVNLAYIDNNPNYLDYDYMNDTSSDWISYTAYYKDSDVHYHSCGLTLVDSLTFDIPVLDIKIVYFNDLGETLFLSDVINIDPELTNSRIEGSLLFNSDTFEITNTIREYESSSFFDNLRFIPMVLFASLFFTPVLIFVSSLTEAIISIFFKFKQINKTSVFFINVFTQIVMYLSFSRIHLPYYSELIIIEMFIYISEYFILTKIFKEESRRKVLYFILVANTATLLMGHLLGFY